MIQIPAAAVEAACDLSYGGRQLGRLHAKRLISIVAPLIVAAELEALAADADERRREWSPRELRLRAAELRSGGSDA